MARESSHHVVCLGNRAVGGTWISGIDDEKVIVPRRYSVEFRRKVFDLIEAGRPIADVAVQLTVSDQTIYNWRAQDQIMRARWRVEERLFGLFSTGDLAPRWTGMAATNPPSGPQRCNEANPAAANEPTLASMTRKAIELLAADTEDRRRARGFFLQVESASIDKRDHVSQPCEQIGETVNFDEAVAAALEVARRDKNTPIIVTSDHAHTSQIVEADEAPAGFSSILTTEEGQPTMVTYGTGTAATEQGHTGGQIRVAAEGPQGADAVGVIDQTVLFTLMTRALKLDLPPADRGRKASWLSRLVLQ